MPYKLYSDRLACVRRWKARAKDNGKCVVCGKKAEGLSTLCGVHKVKSQIRAELNRMARVENKKCVRCSRKLIPERDGEDATKCVLCCEYHELYRIGVYPCS